MFSRWLGHRQEDRVAVRLYATIVKQARIPWFYGQDGIDDSVQGRLSLLSLHLALMMKALHHKGPKARAVAQALSDIFVQDMDGNLRELGVSDLSLGRTLKRLTGTTRTRADALSKALKESDPLEDMLKKTFFLKAPLSPRKLAAMARYVEQVSQTLCDYSEKTFMQDRDLAFLSFKDMEKIKTHV